MRSAPAAEAWALPGADLLADYDAFVGQLRCGSQGKYLRRMAARRFLTRWPDPAVWMARPTAARLVDIGRTGAWPFLTWAFVSGALVADLDLLGARANGGHFTVWASCHGDDTARALAVATELGWGPAWAHQVCVNALALVCMTSQRTLDGLDSDVLDRFADELAAAPSITANHRRVLVGRLGGLRQVCFQLGLVHEPPPHPNCRPRPWAEHVSAIPQPEIRRVAQRYLEVIGTTLRPATVEDRSDNLESFALWLDEHHPDIGRLSELDRPVIEEFLIWNRTRPSRGRRGRGRPVSTVRVHQGVATLKTFFEDLALWGWAERPAPHLRHHPGQRRDEPAGAHGPARPRHPGDDTALRQPGLRHRARRLRRGHGQDEDQEAPAGGRWRRRLRARAGRVAARRDAQDPGGARRTATAPVIRPPGPAPTPTSASSATTSQPHRSSPLPSTTNWPTCACSGMTLLPVDGTARPPATTG
jgi:hypothetical protein